MSHNKNDIKLREMSLFKDRCSHPDSDEAEQEFPHVALTEESDCVCLSLKAALRDGVTHHTEKKESFSHGISRLKGNVATKDAATKEKNKLRRLRAQRPLEKLIRNAAKRTLNAWKSGHYGGVEAFSTSRKQRKCEWSPCTYYTLTGKHSSTGSFLNGYDIRVVRTRWSPLVAIWGLEGIVCIPMQYVKDGHHPDETDPKGPPVCSQCDEITFGHSLCSKCGAPLF